MYANSKTIFDSKTIFKNNYKIVHQTCNVYNELQINLLDIWNEYTMLTLVYSVIGELINYGCNVYKLSQITLQKFREFRPKVLSFIQFILTLRESLCCTHDILITNYLEAKLFNYIKRPVRRVYLIKA